MESKRKFYTLFLLTIVLLRLGDYFLGKEIVIHGLTIHHVWLGLLIVTIAFFLPRKDVKEKDVLFPIGFAMIADEIILFFIGFENYRSGYSFLGIALMSVFIFFVMDRNFWHGWYGGIQGKLHSASNSVQ